GQTYRSSRDSSTVGGDPMSRVRDVLRVKGSEVLTVPPGTPVQRVAQRMRTDHIGAFIVSSRIGQLDGLVTERDIVFGIARHGAGALDLPVSAVQSEEARPRRAAA